MQLPIRFLSLLACAGIVLTACSEEPALQQSAIAQQTVVPQQTVQLFSQAFYVVAVNNPLTYFAQRIGGDGLDVRLPAPAEGDPAQWQPSVEELLSMQGAGLILLNGAGYSGWLDKVSLADSQLVVTSAAAREQWIEQVGEVTHSHGPEGEHAHSGYQFTTWMDMQLARVQAQAVAAALVERWPDAQSEVSRNLDVLLTEIDTLDASYAAALARLADRQFIYSHPVYQYFERRYGVPGTSLHWEPDVMPSDGQWRELAGMADENALFVWEGEPDAAIASRMREMGVEFVVIDPAGNVGERDWLVVQRGNIERLRGVTP